MAKMPPVRVALDLEMTGLSAEQDAILEVAAIKFQGDTIIDTYESIVAPGRAIPFRVQRLTHITPDLLKNAPPFEKLFPTIQRFLGDLPIVGHSIPLDVSFLRKRGLAKTNPLIDTFELASVLLPSLRSYSLGHVAESLDIHVPDGRHRAMVDTELAMRVFQALNTRLQAIDSSLLRDLTNLDVSRSWPLLHFFRQELRDRQEPSGSQGVLGSLGSRFASQLGMNPRVLTFAIDPNNINTTLSIQANRGMQVSNEDSALQKQQDDQNGQDNDVVQAEYNEPIGYQSARTAVRNAFEHHAPLILEVTVGGNDYSSALLPALEWLSESGKEGEQPRKLVIACNTLHNARRLVETVLPNLQARLPQTLPVAYWAERGGYLCPHRWFDIALRRTSGELTVEQARGLAKVGLWAQRTLTGERSELTFIQQENTIWERISSGVERVSTGSKQIDTMYERCTYRKKGYCFVSRAEERVRNARIIVTTHAGLLEDLSQKQSLFEPIEYRMILEADLLDEENARWSNIELNQNRLLMLLNTIGTDIPQNRYQGLLAIAAPTLRENGPGGLSSSTTVAKDELDSRLLSRFQVLKQARTSVEKLFKSYQHLLEEHAQQGTSGSNRPQNVGQRNDPLRLTEQTRGLSAWNDVDKAWQQVATRLQTVIDFACEAEKMMLTTSRGTRSSEMGNGEASSIAAEFAAIAHQLIEQKKLGQQAMSLGESDNVYWLRTPQTSQQSFGNKPSEEVEAMPVLYSQLVQTAPLLRRLLLREHKSTIFVGTSLSVDNSFAYIRERFGLENDACPALSVTDEHHEQTLVYLPNDVPEPNQPQYQRHLEDSLIQLATALKGQTVVLFTSHAALRSTYSAIKQILETRGILVLGQGTDGSARQMWQVFQSEENVVLLGTNNFWDSLEDLQNSPACVVVTRLPMPVLNDPPIAARIEHYSDQLHQLTVPVAALRLRRILNKLTWNDKRRNVIVLFDRRVTSKEYGPVLLHSLPRCSQRQSNASHMPESVLEWVTGTEVWEE